MRWGFGGVEELRTYVTDDTSQTLCSGGKPCYHPCRFYRIIELVEWWNCAGSVDRHIDPCSDIWLAAAKKRGRQPPFPLGLARLVVPLHLELVNRGGR